MLFLFFPLLSYANFTLNGTIITQTGTDTDLSGLASIAGVSTYKEGQRTIYDIGARALHIDGILTSDARVEGVMSTLNDLALRITGGTLTINDFIDDGVDKTYLQDKWFSMDVTGSGRFFLDADSTLNMNGGWIECRGVATSEALTNSISYNIEYAVFGSFDSADVDNQFRSFTENLSITGKMILRRMSYIPRTVPLSVPAVEFEYSNTAVIVSGNSPVTEQLFDDFKLIGDGNAAKLWGSKKIVFKNSEKGTDYSVGNNIPGHGSSTGTVTFKKDVQFDITNLDGTDLENVRVFAKGTNHGGLTNGNGYTFTNLETYFESTAASGNTNVFTVLLGGVNEPVLDATPDFFYLGKNNDNTDLFDFYIWHYNYLGAQTEQNLKGQGTKVIPWTLFDDSNITESNSATVAAYTSIDNLDELYDYAKYWKTLNNQSNVETPAIDTLLVRVDGTRLILPDNWDLTVDATASSVFTVDSNNQTITINSSTLVVGDKFEGIETTGTITTANGATLEHGYIDATGTNIFVDLDWNEATELNILIENLDDNSSIISATATEAYKGHFLQPDPLPTNGIRAQLETDNEIVLFQETTPDNELSYIRRGIGLNATGEQQFKILYLLRKILQKEEAINSVLNGTMPNITDNTTITTSNQTATIENQIAALQLLRRILTKVTANREAIKN